MTFGKVMTALAYSCLLGIPLGRPDKFSLPGLSQYPDFNCCVAVLTADWSPPLPLHVRNSTRRLAACFQQ